MARSKEFDYYEVLSKSLDVFLEKGYNNTSIQDLVSNIGLGRGSIYNAFGSKHGLFLEVLNHYLESRDVLLLKRLMKSPVKDSFSNYFMETINEMVINPYTKSCFIVNTMTELASSDQQVKEILIKSETQLVATYKTALDFGIKNDNLRISNSQQLASFLSNTMKGLRVISQVDNSRENLEGNASLALTLIK